jgi:hypothetical protein
MRMRGWLVAIVGVGLAGGVDAAPKPIDPATPAVKTRTRLSGEIAETSIALAKP